MNKQKIELYITHRAVSEMKPGTAELVPYRHKFSHPDATILIFKCTSGVKTSGRYDEIRHAVMVALQANGVSVSALRDYSAIPKAASSKVSKKQMRLI